MPDVVDFDAAKTTREPWQIPSVQYLGQLNPKLVGGFNTYLKYKNLEFATEWTFKMGHLVPTFNDYQNAPRNLGNVDANFMAAGYSGDLSVSSTNRQKKYLNYWQLPGDQTEVRKFVDGTNDLWASMYTNDKYEKGDYLRLNNLSLSYRFDPKIIEKYRLKNMQLVFNVRNLITFTAYKGIDVATGDAFSYPVSREFSIKLALGF